MQKSRLAVPDSSMARMSHQRLTADAYTGQLVTLRVVSNAESDFLFPWFKRWLLEISYRYRKGHISLRGPAQWIRVK